MQEIDQELYQNNPFYRDIVDRMIANEREIAHLQQKRDAPQRKLQDEWARKDAEMAYRQQRMLDYVNQIPYQQMTPVQPMQWRAPYPVYQNNFVNYWSAPQATYAQQDPPVQQNRAEQIEELRRAFHSAVDCAAQCSKQEAPVPSLIFDGLGVMTAGNLFELAKSVVSLIDTATRL